ncbi:hypothetical protein BKA70DRAFT_1266145 [Coprinopsis sp. MPI-PUGE-AT-0042]|nr:hypothetical protein BKA70DRAFT_1266145 [Coprinopsis sp. MPI-PUGE-AT-0042]
MTHFMVLDSNLRWTDYKLETTPLHPQQRSITEVTLAMPAYNCKRIGKTPPASEASSGDSGKGDSPPFTPIHVGDVDFSCIDAGVLTPTQLRSREGVLRGMLSNPNEVKILSEAGLDLAWTSGSAYVCGAVGMVLTFGGSGIRRARMIVDAFTYGFCKDEKRHSAMIFPEDDLLEEGEDENKYFQRFEVTPEEGLTITGKIDYLLWPLKREISDEQRKRYLKLGNLESAILASAQLDTSVIGTLMFNVHSIQDRSWDGLKKHLPQVIMNAYLCMLKAKRKVMPCVLTNGLLWFFGIVKGGEGDTPNTFGYFGVEALNHEEKMDSEHYKAAAVDIFRTLMHWAYGDPGLLFEAFIAKEDHIYTVKPYLDDDESDYMDYVLVL